MRFLKIVKLTGYTYACNDLTNFEYQAQAMTGNGNCMNLLKLVKKNLLNHIKGTYFWWVLAIWNHCAIPQKPAACGATARAHSGRLCAAQWARRELR